jgi:UDP-N-acetylmuramoylalanine--D-glutamate ligase
VQSPDYCGETLGITMCEDLSEAVKAAHDAAQPGDVVILSPASASFDRFKNFEERGNFFKSLVMEL